MLNFHIRRRSFPLAWRGSFDLTFSNIVNFIFFITCPGRLKWAPVVLDWIWFLTYKYVDILYFWNLWSFQFTVLCNILCHTAAYRSCFCYHKKLVFKFSIQIYYNYSACPILPQKFVKSFSWLNQKTKLSFCQITMNLPRVFITKFFL